MANIQRAKRVVEDGQQPRQEGGSQPITIEEDEIFPKYQSQSIQQPG